MTTAAGQKYDKNADATLLAQFGVRVWSVLYSYDDNRLPRTPDVRGCYQIPGKKSLLCDFVENDEPKL